MDRINQFVNELLAFKADDTLNFTISQNEAVFENRIAADSLSAPDYAKIGVFENHIKDVLIRVFKDRLNKKYDLYLLSEKEQMNRYPVLFHPDSFKYFVIGKDRKIEIPFDTEIDPRRDTFCIEYPKTTLSFSSSKPTGDDIDLSYDRMTVHVDENIKKALFVFTDKNRKIYRLVPVRNGLATVILPNTIGDDIIVSLF